MTKTEIISLFRLFMDDTSELSTAEESSIFDRNYRRVWNEKVWEFSKKEASGTTNGTLYISLPSDFMFIIDNDNFNEDYEGDRKRPIIKVGPTNYKIVNWSERKKYADRNDYAWVDLTNNRIEFAIAPASGLAYSFDYKYSPVALGSSDSPAFHSDFHHILYHAMCIDSFVIQQSEKAKSYMPENQAQYLDWLSKLKMYDANLQQI